MWVGEACSWLERFAAAKATLSALFFMHAITEKKLVWLPFPGK
jgi:hypothetical protein